MQIGQKLQEARKARGLTQEAAAELVGVSRQTISNWERGKSLPDVLSVIRMSEAYDCSLDTLLKGDAQMEDKIRRDTDVTSRLRNMTYASYAALAMGAVVALFGPDAGTMQSPVAQFVVAALPWVLLALGLACFAAAYGAKQESSAASDKDAPQDTTSN